MNSQIFCLFLVCFMFFSAAAEEKESLKVPDSVVDNIINELKKAGCSSDSPVEKQNAFRDCLNAVDPVYVKANDEGVAKNGKCAPLTKNSNPDYPNLAVCATLGASGVSKEEERSLLKCIVSLAGKKPNVEYVKQCQPKEE